MPIYLLLGLVDFCSTLSCYGVAQGGIGMALGKSPQKQRKAGARSSDALVSPARHRHSTTSKPTTSKAKARVRRTAQHLPLTVDIPTAPFLGNFLSPLEVAAIEQVSGSTVTLNHSKLHSYRLQATTHPSVFSNMLQYRRTVKTVLEGFLLLLLHRQNKAIKVLLP